MWKCANEHSAGIVCLCDVAALLREFRWLACHAKLSQLSRVNDEGASAAQFTCRPTALQLHYDRHEHANSTKRSASTIPADFGAAAAGS